jgi:hypothetical protein
MRACRVNLDEAENCIRRLNVRVERMLRRNWRKLEALSGELLRAKTLTYRECVEVFNRSPARYQERQNRACS